MLAKSFITSEFYAHAYLSCSLEDNNTIMGLKLWKWLLNILFTFLIANTVYQKGKSKGRQRCNFHGFCYLSRGLATLYNICFYLHSSQAVQRMIYLRKLYSTKRIDRKKGLSFSVCHNNLLTFLSRWDVKEFNIYADSKNSLTVFHWLHCDKKENWCKCKQK